MSTAEERIGASCPSSGDFYVCESSGFIGCCTSDPCKTSNGLCPDSDLEPTSFDSDKYDEILTQDCMGTDSDVAWYTCTGTRGFPFMGCCAVNPCSVGECPDEELRSAKLSGEEKNAQVFLGGDVETSTTSSSRTTSSSTTTSTSEPTTTETESGSNSSSSNDGLSQGAIIGIAVGASIVGMSLIALFFCWFWRRTRRSREAADASKGPLMGFTSPNGPTHDSAQFRDSKYYNSQYSPNTASFQGLQSPQSASFTHPNSPQMYHDRSSYQSGMSPQPQSHHQSWAGSPPPDRQSFLAAGGMYNNNVSPPAHVTSFGMGQQREGGGAPAELPASMTQQGSGLSSSTMSELPANPHTMSMQSYSGVQGRESEVSRMAPSELSSNRL